MHEKAAAFFVVLYLKGPCDDYRPDRISIACLILSVSHQIFSLKIINIFGSEDGLYNELAVLSF